MMDKISNSNLLAVDQGTAPKKAAKSNGASQDDGFAVDLAGAQAVASLNPQSVQAQQPAQPNASNAGSMDGAIDRKPVESPVQAKIGPQASALGAMSRPGTGAERSPLALTSAVSMNTAAAIAGPKPWGKEWVFEGISPGSDIQSLFGAAPQAADLRDSTEAGKGGEAAGALAQLNDLVAQMGKTMGQGAGAEGSAQALDQSALKKAVLEADAAAAQGQFDVAGASDGNGDGDMSELAKLAGPGAFLEQQVQAGPSKAHQAVRTNGPVANASLSGTEYLSTLAALKGGQAEQSGAQSGREQGEQAGQGMNAKADLKVIEGGLKSRKSGSKSDDFVIQDGAAQAGQIGAQKGTHDSVELGVKPKQEVVGHVVKGAMSQDRLSTESLHGIATGIRTLSPNGGGEMKIRLNPDHLGELHVKVMTRGNQVGLQIQASDERARKILEESMSSLKTSLAAQHLTLGQFDLTVAQAASPSGQSSGGDLPGQAQGQAQQQSGDFFGQGRGFDRNGSGSDRWNGTEDRMASSTGVRGAPSALSTAAARTASASRAYAQAGRLDVRA